MSHTATDAAFMEWVSRPGVHDKVLTRFCSHILILSLLDKAMRLEPVSGFLILYRGSLFWISAGHSLEGLRERRKEVAENFIQAKWIEDSGASLPVGVDCLLQRTFEIDEKGLDLSITMMRLLEVEFLIKGNRKVPITIDGWTLPPAWEPIGFGLVGAPASESSVAQLGKVGALVRTRSIVAVTWLPVKGIADRGTEGSSFWGVPDAFYGELLGFDEIADRPDSIKGMSGGPIFGIDRDFEYRLIALQSAQPNSGKPIIRGSPIEWVLQILDKLLAEHGETISDGPPPNAFPAPAD